MKNYIAILSVTALLAGSFASCKYNEPKQQYVNEQEVTNIIGNGKLLNLNDLKQAPYNRIEPIKGIPAYSYLLSSVSSVRWDRRVMDSLTSTLSDIAMTVPCYVMECLPDEDAARTCLSGISRNSE